MTFLPLALLAYAAVAFSKPRSAFFLFIAFLPAYLIRFPLFGIPTTALEVMFVILLAAWFRKREKRLIDIKGWGWLILLWLGVATLQMFVSPDFRAAAGVWKAYFIEPVLFFIMACDFLRAKEDRDLALRALGGTAIVMGALAVIQHFTGLGVPPPFNGVPIPPATEAEFRSTVFYGFPNAVGLFLAPLIPLFLGRLYAEYKNLRLAAYWATASLMAMTAIVLAESEGAMIGAAAGVVALGILIPTTRRFAIRLSALGAVMILLVTPLRNLAIEKGTLNDWSGRVRKEIWAESWQMLKDRPILGAGLAGYKTIFEPYHKARHIEIFQYPHTILLNLWSELGLAGIIVFILMMMNFFRQSFSIKNWPLIGAGIALLVHGLVDVPYFKNDLSMLFWLMMALAASQTVKKS